MNTINKLNKVKLNFKYFRDVTQILQISEDFKRIGEDLKIFHKELQDLKDFGDFTKI